MASLLEILKVNPKKVAHELKKLYGLNDLEILAYFRILKVVYEKYQGEIFFTKEELSKILKEAEVPENIFNRLLESEIIYPIKRNGKIISYELDIPTDILSFPRILAFKPLVSNIINDLMYAAQQSLKIY